MSEKPKGRNLLKRYLCPGVWEDMDGAIHFSLSEILEGLGIENTPENQAQLRASFHKVLSGLVPNATFIDRFKPDDTFGKG
jgi:hypothetical protein